MSQKTSFYLLIISLIICILPLVYLYGEHGLAELEGSEESKADENIKKSIRQHGEGWFFIALAIFYMGSVIAIIASPSSKYRQITYLLLIVVTIAVIIIYYLRTTTGIPVGWSGVWIKEYVVDWNDVITKILQQILVVPASILLVRERRNYH